MSLVVDANVVISALIADSTSRELIVTLDPTLLTPAIVHDEIENHHALIVEKSRMTEERVDQFLDLLFRHIVVVPAGEFHPCIERAEAAIWSDDSDFETQDLVPVYSTDEVIETFATG